MTPKWAIIHCIHTKGGNDDVLEREEKMHVNSAGNVTANVAVLNATMDQSNGDVVEQSCSKGVNCSEMFQSCFCDSQKPVEMSHRNLPSCYVIAQHCSRSVQYCSVSLYHITI